MCGIAGFVDARPSRSAAELERLALAMASTLRSRGPDDEGAWVDPEAGAALAHRRLSIVDLSSAGHQPMVSSSGRYVLSYNGELYDHAELRAELSEAGASFRGRSDSEVLLELCDRVGLEDALPRLNGMFAFALWDRVERRLGLARDRVGIKPLYWRQREGLTLFGSELKALRAHPGWTPRLDRGSLAAYLRLQRVPAPRTIYEDVHQLAPGSWVWLDAKPARPRRYWRLELDPPREPSPDPAAELEALLRDSIRRRLVADVPVGAFLSGGIDSSAVVALAQEVHSQPLRTFTIGFQQASHDEAAFAREVATRLGTDHTEHTVSEAEVLALVDQLPELYDEPFADPSQLPTLLLSRLTRAQVTVALSGDGGDELFASYRRYRFVDELLRRWGKLPSPLRRLARVANRLEPPRLRRALSRLAPGLSWRAHIHLRRAGLVGEAETYRHLVSLWERPAELLPGVREPAADPLWSQDSASRARDPREWLTLLDLEGYLPDCILTKVDRASMSASLEVRVPLLDHRLVERVTRLPAAQRFPPGADKELLRRILARRLPRELFERPKAGFGVPLGAWLRGPLRSWAEPRLDPLALRAAGLDPRPVRAAWRSLQAGQLEGARLWAVLVYVDWHQRWL